MTETLSEIDILSQVIQPQQPGFSPDLAEAILAWRFNQEAIDRMNDLAEKNRQDSLNPSEKEELAKYLRVGHFLNILQAKARCTLRQTPA